MQFNFVDVGSRGVLDKVWNDYVYINKSNSIEETNFIKEIYGMKK